MYGAGDVRVENVPDPTIKEPTDALVRVLQSCICGSDLWPYASLPASDHGQRMGHEFLGVVEDTGSDVAGLKRGDVVIAPFVWSDGTCLIEPSCGSLPRSKSSSNGHMTSCVPHLA
jgi:threonine dehydrogenase-like Zn-dependent dehydrogenase